MKLKEKHLRNLMRSMALEYRIAIDPHEALYQPSFDDRMARAALYLQLAIQYRTLAGQLEASC